MQKCKDRIIMMACDVWYLKEFKCGIVVGGVDGCRNDNTDGVLCDVIAWRNLYDMLCGGII